MELAELKNKIREFGVVGAGGAGFPTYAKLNDQADTILLNCAECEPLLKLHRQLLQHHAAEILETFHLVAESVGAHQGIIGVKGEYKETIAALQDVIGRYPALSIHELPSSYPMGDEVVLIYECTGRQVRPGGLPIEQGVIVFNVETMYNISQGLRSGAPVTSKEITVVGEVEHPVTIVAPLGTKLSEVVAQAGKITTKDPVYVVGGPMMGRFGRPDDPVTKTTNAVLVLPADHHLVTSRRTPVTIDLHRAASTCCQCQTCTDLCPRHALGHPIQPHLFMRYAAGLDTSDVTPYLNTYFCCGCGVCETYACPQGLSPRRLMTDFKGKLRAQGIKAPAGVTPGPVPSWRDYRKVPEERLAARLGLARYDQPAPLNETLLSVNWVRENLSQHIGAPAQPVVKPGDHVTCGQVIAAPADGLSVPVHASIDGIVEEVDGKSIVIANRY